MFFLFLCLKIKKLSRGKITTYKNNMQENFNFFLKKKNVTKETAVF